MEKPPIKPRHFKTRRGWRNWLEKNHGTAPPLWLQFFKKHTRKPGLGYDEAVEEALCFGWIDATLRRIDDEKHMIRFSPRNPKSVWSLANKKRALALIKSGKMTTAGMALIRDAKKSGQWRNAYTSTAPMGIPPDLEKALRRSKAAWKNFEAFAKSYKNQYVGWVLAAKRPETREKRVQTVVLRAKANQKPGVF